MLRPAQQTRARYDHGGATCGGEFIASPAGHHHVVLVGERVRQHRLRRGPRRSPTNRTCQPLATPRPPRGGLTQSLQPPFHHASPYRFARVVRDSRCRLSRCALLSRARARGCAGGSRHHRALGWPFPPTRSRTRQLFRAVGTAASISDFSSKGEFLGYLSIAAPANCLRSCAHHQLKIIYSHCNVMKNEPIEVTLSILFYDRCYVTNFSEGE